MESYRGTSVYRGIAFGKAAVYRKKEQQVRRIHTADSDREWSRFLEAKDKAAEELESLYEKACREVGETGAAVFAMHQVMLEDEDYLEMAEHILRTQQVNAEYAAAAAGDYFVRMFEEMDDEYMRARAADIRDITERMLRLLAGVEQKLAQTGEPVILFAEDLAPSETVQLDKEKILAFVTRGGSVTSHTAILARTMGIPALVGVPVPLEKIRDGESVIVNGTAGIVYLNPDAQTEAEQQRKQQDEMEAKRLLACLKGKETVTADGKKIRLYANIGSLRDLSAVLQNDAEGIGLFRSEFLYLEQDHAPSEEEQFTVYRSAAETMAGKPVIIRTFDIGADKQCDYLQLRKEENPALGMRAIRICLTRPELFRTQLRALFRASAYGKIAILYPMITSVWEIRQIRAIAADVKKELEEAGIAAGNPEQGIMIETPAAVMISRELAKEADFFSIGTNDLTQYTLAADRQNPELSAFYNPYHPAVLEMLRMTIENAHREGIWAGICGELGADLSMTDRFLQMGVDELSVSPASVLSVRGKIKECVTVHATLKQ